MEKTFRMLKVGDRIYRTTIKNSEMQKNAIGGAEHEYIVKEIEQVDFYTFKLTLNRLKVTYDGKFIEDEDTKNSILVIQVDGNSSLKIQALDASIGDTFGLNINNVFFSTSKILLKEHLLGLVAQKRETANKLKALATKLYDNLWLVGLEASHINTTKEEEMQQEMDMMEAATMAL